MDLETKNQLRQFLNTQIGQTLEDEAAQQIQNIIQKLDQLNNYEQFLIGYLKDIGIKGAETNMFIKQFKNTKLYKSKISTTLANHKVINPQMIPKNKIDSQKQIELSDEPLINVDVTIDLFTNEKILLSQFINDKLKVPIGCSQFLLYDVLIHGLLLKNSILIPEYEKSDYSNNNSPVSREKLIEIIKELKNKIIEENRLSQDIKTIFTNIQFNKNDLFDNLISLKKQLLGIDVCDLQRLIDKTKQAQKDIAGKSIILFIGDTGAGKTTTILGLYGFTMVKKKFKGMDWVTASETITDEKLKLLHTSPEQKSITRYPLAILPRQNLSSTEVWFVDTPGFGDSAGVEVDLANGIGTINTIKGCKSVRSIIVISKQSWGTRGAGIKKLAKILGNLFGTYKNVQETVMFIWNRFSQDDLKELNIKIKDLIDNATQEEKTNQNLMSLLEDLYEKTQTQQNIIHYKPLIINAHKDIIKKIKKLKQLKNPDQYFNLAFTETTKLKVKQQCLIYQSIINYHFDNNNIEIVAYFLKNYNLFQSIVPMSQIKKQYDDMVNYLEKTIKSRFSKESQNLSRRMRSFNLSEDDLKTFQKQTMQIQKFKVLDQILLSIPTKNKYKQVLQEQIQILINTLKEEECKDMQKILGTLKLIKKTSSINELKDVQPILRKKLNSLKQQYILLINQSTEESFKKAVDIFKKYKDILKMLEFYVQQDNKMINQLIDILPQYIANEISKNNLNQNPIRITEINCKKWNDLQEKFEKLKSNYQIMILHNDNPNFEKSIDEFKQKLTDLVNRLSQAINILIQQLKQGKKQNFYVESLYTQIQEFERLRQIKSMRQTVQLKIDQRTEKMELYLNAQRKTLDEIQSAIEDKSSKSKLKTLIKNLETALNGIEKLSRFGSQEIRIRGNQLVNNVVQNLIRYLNDNQNQLELISINFKANDQIIRKQLDKITKIMSEIQIFSKATSRLPKNTINQILSKGQEIIHKVINQLNGHIQELIKKGQNKQNPYSNVNLNLIEKGLYFLMIASDQLKEFMKNQITEIKSKYKNELILFKEAIYTEIQNGISGFRATKQINQQLQNECRKIKKRIDLLNQIINKYENIKQFAFEDIDGTLNGFKQSLEQIHSELSRLWDITKKGNSVNDKINLNEKCRILSVFDKILDVSFKKLCEDISLSVEKSNLNINQNIKNSLAVMNFTLLKRDLNILLINKNTPEGQNAFNQAMVEIDTTVKGIASSTNLNLRRNKMSAIKLDIDYFDQLEKMGLIKSNLKQFLTPQSNILCVIEETIKNLEETIKQSFQNSASEVEELIQEQNLLEAQDKCKQLKRNQSIINSCLPHIKRQFKFLYQRQIRIKRWQDQKKQYKKRQNISGMVSQELYIQIIERLEDFKIRYIHIKDEQQFDDKFNTIYRKILDRNEEKGLKGIYKDFKFKIDEKMKQRLQNKIQKFKQQKNLADEKKIIGELNLEIEKIPKKISEEFKETIRVCIQSKQKSRKQQQRMLTQLFSNRSSLRIDEIYDKYEEGDQNKNEDLKNTVKSLISDIIQKLLDQIEKENKQVLDIYEIFKEKVYPFYFFKEKRYFEDLIKKNYIRQFKNVIEKKLQKHNKEIKCIAKLDKNIDQSDNQYQEDNVSTNSTISQRILRYVDKMFAIYVFIQNNKQVELLKTCFIPEFINCIIYYSEKYCKSMQFMREKFIDLESQIKLVQSFTLNFTILSKISTAVIKISTFIKEEIDEKKKYQFEPELKNIKNDISNAGNFRDIQGDIKDKFQKIINQLNRFELDRDDIINADDTQRNTQFEKISNQLLFIKNYEIIYNKIKNEGKKRSRYDECEKNFKKKFERVSQFNEQILQQMENNGKIEEVNLQKFNIYLNILKIYENKFSNLMTSSEESQRKNQNIKKKLHKIIGDYRNKGQTYINTLAVGIENNKCQLTKLSHKKSTQTKQEIEKLSKKYEQTKQKKKLYFQQRIKNENDEKAKQNLENERDSELSTINNEERQQIKKFQDTLSSELQKEQQRIQRPIIQLRKSLAQLLTKLKMFSIYIFEYQKLFKQEIEQIFQLYDRKLTKKAFRPLALAIDSLKNMYGARLLEEESKFSGFKLQKFKRKMDNVGIKQVVQQLDLIQQEKQKLIKKYNKYLQIYNKTLNKFTCSSNKATIQNIIQTIKIQSASVKEDLGKNKPHSGHQLIGYIFGLWTIIKADQSDQGVIYLYQPHPAQIMAIFCILGMAQQGSLGNRFAQVLTGEGKSIILAGLVSYLACIGYQVNCVCYSKYLSERDMKLFRELFSTLSINQYIKYGTFNEICEDLFNSTLKLRKTIQSVLLEPESKLGQAWSKLGKFITSAGKSIKNAFSSDSSRKKILVIDQVDVFFSEDFYGNLYLPYIGINKPIIQRLISFIWKNRQNPEVYAQTMASEQYTRSINQFPSLKDLIFEAVKGMVRSVKNWKHDYIVLDNKIAYKQQDGISFKTNYGYNTIFAYFYECQRGNISIPNRQDATEIGLTIGEFSYSKLPTYFEYIMGVTGTLKILSDVKKKICVQEYKIKENFYIPSVYGKSRRQHKGIKIVPENTHKQQIINQTKAILDSQRSVLIFFETARQANEFQISKQFQLLKSKAVVLTQQHDDDTKLYRINRATVPGNITIMTKSFGRGTDFVIYSEQLRTRGGLHVIQTFLCEQQSEEVQIMGRVARQGDLGSYSLILNANQLQKINLKAEYQNGKVIIKQISNLDDIDEVKKVINQKRNEAYDRNYQISISNAKKYEQNHNRSMEMISNLMEKKTKEVTQYIKSLNSFPEIYKAKPIKTILALDATGSMGNVLAKTASIIGTAFQNAQKIIKANQPGSTFQLQIAIYRNYNCTAQDLFCYTPFECKPENISKFLKEIKASGGWGNQAIQILYEHVNKQVEVDQVIIIGDASVNTYHETVFKRNSERGQQKYWKKTQLYKQPLDSEVELSKLKARNIPIHTFFIGNSPKKYFERISSETNGQCKQLKPNQKTAQNELTDFIAMNILNKLGGAKLLQAYQNAIVKARFK